MTDERIAAISARHSDPHYCLTIDFVPVIHGGTNGVYPTCDTAILLARLREVERERDEQRSLLLGQTANYQGAAHGRAVAMAERDAALAREKRAYTLLVSVQPAAHRATKQSPNVTALRLNGILEDAIQEWVDAYLAAHDEAARG